MPKHSLTFTAKDWLYKNEFGDIDSAIDSIIEYAPDHNFPDNCDHSTIDFLEATYTPEGHVVLIFQYDEEEEDEEEEDESDED